MGIDPGESAARKAQNREPSATTLPPLRPPPQLLFCIFSHVADQSNGERLERVGLVTGRVLGASVMSGEVWLWLIQS